MISSISLIFKIFKKPWKPILPSGQQTIYSFDKNDQRNRLFSKFFKNSITFESLTNASWTDIFLRKIRVTSIPRKILTKSTPEWIKCQLIRYLLLSISNEAKILNIHSILFLETNENLLLTPAGHCGEIYEKHVKHFKVIETFSKYQSYLTIPFYLLSKFIKTQNKNLKRGTTVFTNPSSYLLISAYHNLHPNRTIVIRFHDILSKKNLTLIKRLKSSGIIAEIESYSQQDAQEQQLTYRPNGVDPAFMLSLHTSIRTSLYRFYGAASDKHAAINDRVSALSELNTALHLLYPTISSWIDYKVITLSSTYIPYPEFAKLSTQCEIYLDLARIKPSEGFSYRTVEALFLNRKIITNRSCLKNEPFYHPDRIFILGEDSFCRLQSFLESDISPLPKHILKLYDSSLWWTDKDPLSTPIKRNIQFEPRKT